MTLRNRYGIEPTGTEFKLIDVNGLELGAFSTECAAREDLWRRQNEDALLDTAQLLVNVAVKGHILIHGTDRETALYWIRKALHWEPAIATSPATLKVADRG